MFSCKDLCIVIVFYNGEDITEKIIKWKKICNCILIVDNGSDKEKSVLLNNVIDYEEVTVYKKTYNGGIASALNDGLAYAHENNKALLLTMDQDTEISNESIIGLIEHIDLVNKVVSVGASYKKNHSNQEVKYLITSGNLVYVDAILAVGGYYNYLFIDGVDIEISFRLLVNKYRMIRVGLSSMTHKIGECENSRFLKIPYFSHSPKRFYYMYRNNIIIFKKYIIKLPGNCIKLFLSLCCATLKLFLIEKNKKEKIVFAIKGIKSGISYKE